MFWLVENGPHLGHFSNRYTVCTSGHCLPQQSRSPSIANILKVAHFLRNFITTGFFFLAHSSLTSFFSPLSYSMYEIKICFTFHVFRPERARWQQGHRRRYLPCWRKFRKSSFSTQISVCNCIIGQCNVSHTRINQQTQTWSSMFVTCEIFKKF